MDNFGAILDYHARHRPDKIVITHGPRTLTAAELLDRVKSLSEALLDLGVRHGDRVGLLLYNRPEFIELIFAANRIGAAVLPLNYRLAPAEWQYILGHAGVSILFSEQEFVDGIESVAANLPTLRHRLSVDIDRDAGAWLSYAHLLAGHTHATIDVAEVEPDDLQRLMYTSGTTSHPKGVCISHRNLMYKNLGLLVQFGWTDQEITAVAGPLYHVGALDMGGLATIHAGGSLVLQTKFDADGLISLIEGHRVSNVWLAPAMVRALLEVPRLASADLTSLKLILSGGEKMPETRLSHLLDLFPNLWFADAYGLTETVSSDTFMPREYMRQKLGSVGLPIPHVQVRVVDEHGVTLPPAVRGEIVIRGPKVFGGYWQDAEATSAAIQDGWFHTGDVGYQDADGFLYIEDRKKDMIISGGENIASSEVERVLYEHDDVLEAAVVARPHERWGEVPHAFVVRRAEATTDGDAIIAYCSARLAKYKVPKSVEFVDVLPRTPSGKVLKRLLRDQLDSADP